jgi:hypothetical protein
MGHLGCCQSLAIVNSAEVNMGVQVALFYPGAHSFRCMAWSAITGFDGSFSFSSLRTLHTAFHSSWTNFHSHWQWIRISFSPVSSPAFVVVCVLDDSHSDWDEVESQCF